MFKSFLVLLAAWLLAATAHASVVIGTTRVIYPASAAEVTVQVFNRDPTPALLQVWLDDGDAAADPQVIQVPFLVSPAMFRVEATKGQALRVMHTGEPLAADRESLYWLNMLQVPPRADGAANQLQMAIRTRIKLMYRPLGLPGKAADAPPEVRWRLVKEGGRPALLADNPSPYVVNLGEVNLVSGAQVLPAGAGHVLPFAQARFYLAEDASPIDGDGTVRYIALDDYGAGRPGEAQVGPP